MNHRAHHRKRTTKERRTPLGLPQGNSLIKGGRGRHSTLQYDNERALSRLDRNELAYECSQLDVPLHIADDDTFGRIINKILLTYVEKQFTTIKKTNDDDQQLNNTMNDYNQGALEYTLPWPIIQRILTYASRYNNRCTCVNTDALKITHQSRSRNLFQRDRWDPQHQTILHTNMVLQSEVKQHSLTRDQLCPLHQFNLDQGYEPNFVLDSSPFNQVSREDCRWMRSMALLSKRVFAFISTTLFTNIVMDPTADTWNHITNNYCIIKQPKILTLVSPSSDTQLFFTNKSQSSSSVQFLKNVEKIYINNPHLVENGSTIESLINSTPSLRSLTIKCDVGLSLADLFQNAIMKSITSINFGNALCQLTPFQLTSSIMSCLTKIILPFAFDWNSLSKDIKQNLQVISLLFIDPMDATLQLDPIDFPSLRHVHAVTIFGRLINVPNHVDKVTCFSDASPTSIAYTPRIPKYPNQNISTLRIRFGQEKVPYKYLIDRSVTITSLKKIILFNSFTDVCQDQVNYFNSIGFNYFGSSFSVHSNTKKLIYFKKGETNNNLNGSNNDINVNNNNNNNNNNQQIEQPLIPTMTTILSDNNKNIILPNTIINKIIKMTWKLRERCTCVYEKETIQKWIKIGYDILKDEQELERFNQMKDNCPTHFSHTQPYQPLTYGLKSSNRSKLQLALINKDIFNYIANNCFSIINLNSQQFNNNTIQHINNPYCVAFKHFTTIKGNNDNDNIAKLLLNIKDNLPYITKVVLSSGDYLQDIIKLLPNLTSIDISQTDKSSYRRIDIANLCQLKHLTKLDLTGAGLRYDTSLVDEIKDMPLKKLCVPQFYHFTYNEIPLRLKHSITKMCSLPHSWGYLKQLPNLNHIVVLFDLDSSKWKLPKTVTKITLYTFEIGFLAHNKSVKILKLKVPSPTSSKMDLFLKTLSSPQYSHVQTIIYCLDYSRTSLDYNMSQYLKLSRINTYLDTVPNQSTKDHVDHSDQNRGSNFCNIL
ncbi:hypothetical protein DFA_11341 [Cavenderia fasciculata]|uniref:Uncharacterized protein n=1 Tax=Cavenderia fasciculata TaxID=261658 RepID=F4QCE5_CACFS|nr:uncharacterized protein DFA_11341 [Cavenderia fasciculata]EGG13580.1 hypothetical protein DFA_11341 [Cavenderia fasciculata]|eukprot:XP_004350284.1 hypothetical protein DFA_11341 [Cavenderia fasciculata]